MIKKIVSGGQTGVDRAALDTAIELNIPHGGWCPKGRLSESDIIPHYYNLIETSTNRYSERTLLNIKDSDGTLIIVEQWPTSVTDGTVLTIKEVIKSNKPYLILNLSNKKSPADINKWIEENHIKTLNIAGPRESQSPGIYKKSYELMRSIFAEKISRSN